ncbi:uncharacterized protein LOC113152763 [Anabas testudineus]|uniref:uncharacterized protein LOC113152763 n=1 Tax=Anabas testudineus TaxID=64144 RepID=UPI000E45B8E8|nr:uncharacterized protein LOC113152763 [Anabas testudineus]
MVHSGTASPMKTTPSASPHLPVPDTASPLQVAPPLVPPSKDTSGQDRTQIPVKLVTTELTSNLDLTQSTTPSPSSAEPPVVTPGRSLTTCPSQASTWSSIQSPHATQLPVNGRTSGRKRTPKACDCCGPNSIGHNVRTAGKGRGRGRGRGRGTDKDLSETPKRKVGGQLTRLKCFDLTEEMVEEAENEDDTHKNVQVTQVVTDTQSQTLVPLAVTSLQDGSIMNCVTPEKVNTQKNEHMWMEGSEVTGLVKKGGEDAELRSSGMAGRGAIVVRGRGRGMTEALQMKVEVGGGGVIVCFKNDSPPQTVSLQRQEDNKDADMEHIEQIDSCMVKSPFGNGDTVNLCDTEPEEESKEDNLIMNEPGNGLLSILSPASRSETQDLESEMQVDQISDKTDQVSLSVTLSNGSFTTDHNHISASMEMETSHPPTVSPPNQDPITVCKIQHHCALRDHVLYCHPGTWEKGEMKEMLGRDQSEETSGKPQNKESLEQLTDMIHEFLESFYIKYGSFIPLSETDVLEYLKKNSNSDLRNKGLDIKKTMSRYRAGLASAPIAGFMVMYNKHTLNLEDLATLEEQNWLNDQIINMYGELIMEATQQKVHFFNSFFHKQLVAKGYDGVKRWTKKVDLFSKWLLLIPIHLEIHWSLVTVTMATKTISYYDSQGIVFRHTTDNIVKYLQSEAREKKQTAFQKGWKITIIKGIPQQKNDSDCGVFVLEYCRCLSVKRPLLFSQEDMPRIRNRIYKELCDCRLND